MANPRRRWRVTSRSLYLVRVKRAGLPLVYEIEWSRSASDARTWSKQQATDYAAIVGGVIEEAHND